MAGQLKGNENAVHPLVFSLFYLPSDRDTPRTKQPRRAKHKEGDILRTKRIFRVFELVYGIKQAMRVSLRGLKLPM